MGRFQNAARGADRLGRLYLPQVEQFGVELSERGGMLVGARSDERADVAVCVRRLGGVALVTSHRIYVRSDIPFREGGERGLCIAALCADSLALCPVEQPARPRRHGNVAVFGQDGCERAAPLAAGSRQDAVSVTLLPEWFDRVGAPHRAAARELMDGVGEAWPEEPAAELRALLRQASPLFGGRVADGRGLWEQVGRVAARALLWHEERERAEAAAGTLAQARLVRAARHRVAQHLGEPLSLDALARDLLTSRTRLCAAFRRETGESLGAYIARERMARAERLLACPSLSVAEVAREVGYERPSSFTVAFERAHGCSPSVWRAAAR